jgi:hypothetical protein
VYVLVKNGLGKRYDDIADRVGPMLLVFRKCLQKQERIWNAKVVPTVGLNKRIKAKGIINIAVTLM